jgi:hypothetical protein
MVAPEEQVSRCFAAAGGAIATAARLAATRTTRAVTCQVYCEGHASRKRGEHAVACVIRAASPLIALLLVAISDGAATAKIPRFSNPPKFTSHRIVDGSSIGGVKIGMRKAGAVKVWGKPDGRCYRIDPYSPDDRQRGCSYGGFIQTRKGKVSGRSLAGFTYLPSGEVTSVWISLIKDKEPTNQLQQKLAAPMVLPFKSAQGIGLRSTLEAARGAYGIQIPPNVPSYREGDFTRRVIVRRPDACTVFSWSMSKPIFTYVDTIAVYGGAWCPADPDPVEE